MMSTLEKLQAMRLQFKKDGNSKMATLLSTVLGDFQNKMSRPDASDEETTLLAVLRYFQKNVKEFKGNLESTASGKGDPRYADLLAEEKVLADLLPAQLSEDQLRIALEALRDSLSLQGAKNKGKLMSALKEKHGGLYDGKLAAQLSSVVLGA
jgi:uncharacterized protein